MEKISLAVPVHEFAYRWNMVKRILDYAEHDDRIDEVVLSVEPEKTRIHVSRPKVRCLYNDRREFVFRNKYKAIKACSCPWVIILDSDNYPDVSYVDAIYKQYPWDAKTIYQPEFARPSFDFRRFSGKNIDAVAIRNNMEIGTFRVMMNAMNYFINKDSFISANRVAFDSGYDPKCADSIFINYNLFISGCSMKVVPGMQYQHLIHNSSFYKQNAKQYRTIVSEIEAKMRNL